MRMGVRLYYLGEGIGVPERALGWIGVRMHGSYRNEYRESEIKQERREDIERVRER